MRADTDVMPPYRLLLCSSLEWYTFLMMPYPDCLGNQVAKQMFVSYLWLVENYLINASDKNSTCVHIIKV